MPSLWIGFEIIINLIENICLIYFTWRLFHRDASEKFVGWGSVSCIVFGTIWLSLYLFFDMGNVPDILSAIVIIVLYAVLHLRARWHLAVVWSLFCVGTIGIIFVLMINLLVSILDTPFELFFTSDNVRILFLTLAHASWLFLMSQIIILLKPLRTPLLERKEHALFAFVPLITVMLLFLLLDYAHNATTDTVSPLFTAIICVGLLLINIGNVYVFNQMEKQTTQMMTMQSQIQLSIMASEHQSDLERMTDELRRFRHDISNHIYTITGLNDMGDQNGLRTYLSSLTHSIETYTMLITTGNHALDALMNAKIGSAHDKGIRVNASIEVTEDLTISNSDLNILIGNLFNNAVEACAKLSDITKCYITVDIHIEKSCLLIHFENSTDGTEKKQDGKWLTTKPSRRLNSYGLMSIDYIVKQYDGYCERQHHNGVFLTIIRLPL